MYHVPISSMTDCSAPRIFKTKRPWNHNQDIADAAFASAQQSNSNPYFAREHVFSVSFLKLSYKLAVILTILLVAVESSAVDIPSVSSPPFLSLDDVELHVSQPFKFELHQGLHCNLVGSHELPLWIFCDPITGHFYALPPKSAVGNHFINVTVIDRLQHIVQSDVFALQVLDEPQRTQCAVFTLRVTIDEPFHVISLKDKVNIASSVTGFVRKVIPDAWLAVASIHPAFFHGLTPGLFYQTCKS